MRVTARNGRTSVALRVDPEVIPASGLLDILRLVAAGVRQAALDPQVSLASLWQAPVELPATLFPRLLPAPPAGAVA